MPKDVVEAYRRRGLVVLRDFFDPTALATEVDRALEDGCRPGSTPNVGTAGNAFRYVPMMCESTPASLALLDALAEPATLLLERNVIPTRAKGTSYFGATPWHRDSDLPIASIGLAAYLEPLDDSNGALRVLEGSHHDLAASPPTALKEHRSSEAGSVVATKPGDIIAFDEHLWHASSGGNRRTQWRVDFVVDPISAREEALVRDFFARIFPPGWDGGYDSVRYPTYGPYWQGSGRPWVDRLRQLGADRLARDQ